MVYSSYTFDIMQCTYSVMRPEKDCILGNKIEKMIAQHWLNENYW